MTMNDIVEEAKKQKDNLDKKLSELEGIPENSGEINKTKNEIVEIEKLLDGVKSAAENHDANISKRLSSLSGENTSTEYNGGRFVIKEGELPPLMQKKYEEAKAKYEGSPGHERELSELEKWKESYLADMKEIIGMSSSGENTSTSPDQIEVPVTTDGTENTHRLYLDDPAMLVGPKDGTDNPVMNDPGIHVKPKDGTDNPVMNDPGIHVKPNYKTDENGRPYIEIPIKTDESNIESTGLVLENDTSVNNNEITRLSPYQEATKYFNDNYNHGKLQESVGKQYDSNGKVTKYIYYDEKGREAIYVDVDGDGKQTRTVDIFYDDDGNVVRKRETVTGGSVTEVEYDTDGNIVNRTVGGEKAFIPDSKNIDNALSGDTKQSKNRGYYDPETGEVWTYVNPDGGDQHINRPQLAIDRLDGKTVILDENGNPKVIEQNADDAGYWVSSSGKTTKDKSTNWLEYYKDLSGNEYIDYGSQYGSGIHNWTNLETGEHFFLNPPGYDAPVSLAYSNSQQITKNFYDYLEKNDIFDIVNKDWSSITAELISKLDNNIKEFEVGMLFSFAGALSGKCMGMLSDNTYMAIEDLKTLKDYLTNNLEKVTLHVEEFKQNLIKIDELKEKIEKKAEEVEKKAKELEQAQAKVDGIRANEPSSEITEKDKDGKTISMPNPAHSSWEVELNAAENERIKIQKELEMLQKELNDLTNDLDNVMEASVVCLKSIKEYDDVIISYQNKYNL